MTLLVDSNEPDSIVRLLKQSVPVTVTNLNSLHMSDYFFSNYEGKTFQFSRKQAAELVGNIDEAEDQLRDYYQKADENFQIVEGIISPTPLAVLTDKQLHAVRSGKLLWKQLRYDPVARQPESGSAPSTRIPTPITYGSYTYKVEDIADSSGDERYVLTGGRAFTSPITIVYVWFHRLAQSGIVTYQTLLWSETARLLALIYKNEQKPPENHSTLQRVIKPRIQIREAEPFLKSLLFLSNAYKLGIGETKATALAEHFCNMLDLATADLDEVASVEGIGRKIAEKTLKALGREV